MSEVERPDGNAAPLEGGLYSRLRTWFQDICWEFDSQDRSIRASEFHQRVRIVAWVALALILWRLGVLMLRVVLDVHPMPEFALQADEDGIRTALLYVVGGVILVPFGLFIAWVLLKWLWNLSLDLVRNRMARILQPLAVPIVGLIWLQLLFLQRRTLSALFWDAYYSIGHTLDLADKFSMG
jgi:hypothetical protein